MRFVRSRLPLVLAALAATATALVLAGSASAAGGTHTQTLTQNFHGTQSLTDVNPCTGNAIDIDQTTNMVFHLTWFPAGDEEWGTFTEEDKVSATDEGTGVVYTGHATFWGNMNINNQNSNSTFIAALHVNGSDGSSISQHEVAHITMLPSGGVSVTFDKPSLTCG